LEDLEKLDRFAESVEGELLKLIHGVGRVERFLGNVAKNLSI
jgi:hypothetical protein